MIQTLTATNTQRQTINLFILINMAGIFLTRIWNVNYKQFYMATRISNNANMLPKHQDWHYFSWHCKQHVMFPQAHDTMQTNWV